MKKIAKQLTELIGNTPLLELSNYEKENDLKSSIIAKLEYFNPLGSVKDRVAYAMIEQGIKDGYHRAYQWKYRNWSCICYGSKRLASYFDNAGHHERGAS